MGLSRFRKMAWLATLALSLAVGPARATPVDSIAHLLRQGDPLVTAAVTDFVIRARYQGPVQELLARHGLDTLSTDGVRAGLPASLRREPELWALRFLSRRGPRAPKALMSPEQAADLYKRNDELGKGFDLAGDGEPAGKLDKVFDNKGPAKGNPSVFGGGDGGNPEPPRADNTSPNAWGGKPPPRTGGNGGNDDRITFDDVVGIDEQKENLMEIVDMLKNPERYRRAGADIPTGILLAGPPGTGKTYTARALANEAGVTFLSIGGPEFINKYVGESANKVREFFAQARAKAPCIVFIDEIEALAGKRVDATQGADKETNGAVTQLLLEMDGMTDNPNGSKPMVIVVGATNRVDMLDPAVLRPGRFDRKVIFNLPDVKGREAVLNLYVNKRKKKGVPYGPDLDLKAIARATTGMSPADLKNVINVASTLAARENRQRNESPDKIQIVQGHLRKAIDMVQIGTERKMVMTEQDKKQTAFHELGHAFVGTYAVGGDPITKITIIPRDTGAGGVTVTQPAEDRAYWTKTQFLARIAMSMGGRAAEQIFFGEITTGPSSDLEHASNLAREMVMRYGMSDEIGPVTFVQSQEGNFLNRGGRLQAVSEATQQKIDAEIKRIVLEQEKTATALLEQHRATLEKIVPELLVKETLEGDEFRALLKKHGGNPPPGGNGGAGSFTSARRMSPAGR